MLYTAFEPLIPIISFHKKIMSEFPKLAKAVHPSFHAIETQLSLNSSARHPVKKW